MGVKAEVEKTRTGFRWSGDAVDKGLIDRTVGGDDDSEEEDVGGRGKGEGDNAWVDVAVEIPGMRDDDSLPVFLGSLIEEAVLADGELVGRLCINSRWHWRVFLDVSCFLGVLPFLYFSLWGSEMVLNCTANDVADPPPFSAVVVPITSSLPDHPPRPPIHAPPTTKIRSR